MRSHPWFRHRSIPALLACLVIGAFTYVSTVPASADAAGLTATFTFSCNADKSMGVVDYTVHNNDLLVHDFEYLFTLDGGNSGSIAHLDAGQAEISGSYPVPDMSTFKMIVDENLVVFADSGEHIADMSFANCFVFDIDSADDPVPPTIEFSSKCIETGSLFQAKAKSNDGLEHKMKLVVEVAGTPQEVVDAAFWLVQGSPTAHSAVGIAPGTVARLIVTEGDTVLAESGWWQADIFAADCSTDAAAPAAGDGDESSDNGTSDDPPATEPVTETGVEAASTTRHDVTTALPRTGTSHATIEAIVGMMFLLAGGGCLMLNRHRRVEF